MILLPLEHIIKSKHIIMFLLLSSDKTKITAVNLIAFLKLNFFKQNQKRSHCSLPKLRSFLSNTHTSSQDKSTHYIYNKLFNAQPGLRGGQYLLWHQVLQNTLILKLLPGQSRSVLNPCLIFFSFIPFFFLSRCDIPTCLLPLSCLLCNYYQVQTIHDGTPSTSRNMTRLNACRGYSLLL